MLYPEARSARARLAAYRRWHPDDGPAELDRLTAECERELWASGNDEKIDDLVDAAPRLTVVQASRIRKLADTLTEGRQ